MMGIIFRSDLRVFIMLYLTELWWLMSTSRLIYDTLYENERQILMIHLEIVIMDSVWWKTILIAISLA